MFVLSSLLYRAVHITHSETVFDKLGCESKTKMVGKGANRGIIDQNNDPTDVGPIPIDLAYVYV